MFPTNYQCDGQINLFDYLSSIEPKKKPYEYDFERYVGQKVIVWGVDDIEKQKGVITAFDHYYTEVDCNGEEYACTCLNVSPCYLPEIEEVIRAIKNQFGIDFQEGVSDWDNSGRKLFTHKFKKVELEIHDSNYSGTDERFVSVWWNGKGWGSGYPCDDMDEVITSIKSNLERVSK